jgi:hypothetical protein
VYYTFFGYLLEGQKVQIKNPPAEPCLSVQRAGFQEPLYAIRLLRDASDAQVAIKQRAKGKQTKQRQ